MMTMLKAYILLAFALTLVGGILVWRNPEKMNLNESIVIKENMMKVKDYPLNITPFSLISYKRVMYSDFTKTKRYYYVRYFRFCTSQD